MTELSKGRVIVTHGRSVMALIAIHSLAKKGVEVIACDEIDLTLAKFSKYTKAHFIHAPKDNLEQYLSDIEAAVKRYKPDDDRPYVLMPIHRDSMIIAKYKDRFEPLIKVACPEFESVNMLHPKDHFYNFANQIGLRIPKSFQVSDINQIIDQLEFPVLVKPIDGTAGRGIVIVQTKENLQEAYNSVKEKSCCMPIVQEFISGEDYCFAGIYQQGELKAHMAYHNIYNFPRPAGAGIMRETVDDSPFIDIASQLMKKLKWNGVAEIDFRWDGNPNNQAYAIEVNPRFWGGLFQSVESGIDFPWLLYELTVTGKIIEKQSAIIGTKTKIPLLWFISAVQDLFGKKEISENENKFDLLKILKELIELHEKGDEANNEFIFQDDPYVFLGVLYIISSLIKRGELPPEVKF